MDGFWRGLPLGRITLGVECLRNRQGFKMARAFQFPGRRRCHFGLDCRKITLRQRGRQLVVRQQLDSPVKVFRQHLHRKILPGRFVGGDVIERLLKRQAVERFCAKGKEPPQHVVHPVLPLGRFDIRVRLDAAIHGDRVAHRFRLHDDRQAVG